jgi:polyphosphate kinase
VRSIVDRFLEHSRVFYFENSCQPEVIIGSADWMPRNLFKRIEVCLPIEDGNLRDRLITEVLGVTLADNVKARRLQADGTYTRVKRPNSAPARRSQFEFVELARAAAEPRGETMTRPKGKRRMPHIKLRSRPT